MTDVTMGVGEIRPMVAGWTPEHQLLEPWAPPPSPGQYVDGTPAATPASPAPTVAAIGTAYLRELELLPASRLRDLARTASRLLSSRPADLWLGLECLAVASVGLLTMWLVGVHGPAAVVSLAGVLAVAWGTRGQLGAGGQVALAPVLRSLAVAFAAGAAVSAFGLAEPHGLAGAAWMVLTTGAVIVTTLALRRLLGQPARVLVVGDHAAISRSVMLWSDGSAHVVGGVLSGPDETGLRSIVGVPTYAGLEHTADWARARQADLVIVVPGPHLRGHAVRALAWSLERTGIRMAVSDLAGDAAPHRQRARRLGLSTVVEVAPSRPSVATRMAKNAVDRLVGLVLLALASPFLAVMMLMVRLDSPGRALFRQQRVGRDGRTFVMYKLRTMRVDAEHHLPTLRDRNDGAGPLFKIYDDPRVTRVGRLLRRTSMDELPQLINVLKGEMSLVGPRPALPAEVAEYDDMERRRLAVKPGMTGLWQVSGRSNLDWDTSVALDLDYVDNHRLSDDVLIGLRTLGAVVRARGAY
jgi:exopolysaccharide biosynthesis polyprenyl glycosylphosphotransferase